MDTLIVVKGLGIYLIVSGLFILFRGKTLPLLIKDLLQHRAVMWLAGFILIMVGSVIVFGTNDSQLVAVIGWLVLLKGVVYILVPESLTSFAKKIPSSALALLGLAIIYLGLLLSGILQYPVL